MQPISQIMPRATENPSQSAAGENPKRYSPTSRDVKLVTALWQRMRQLFGHKWTSQAGPAKLANGRYSPEFLLWCRKLHRLSDADYQRGFYMLEHRVREAAMLGEEEWPPSYAGFLGLCERHHEAVAHKPFRRDRALEDHAAKERRRQLGMEQCGKLLDMLSDGEAS